jgi:hypothetical protein
MAEVPGKAGECEVWAGCCAAGANGLSDAPWGKLNWSWGEWEEENISPPKGDCVAGEAAGKGDWVEGEAAAGKGDSLGKRDGWAGDWAAWGWAGVSEGKEKFPNEGCAGCAAGKGEWAGKDWVGNDDEGWEWEGKWDC